MKVSDESSAAPVAPEEAMISLVICTRDRADKLAMMLESLNSINDIARCEVVIVDNNSTDSPPDVIEQYPVTSNSRGTQHLFESARGTGFNRGSRTLMLRLSLVKCAACNLGQSRRGVN